MSDDNANDKEERPSDVKDTERRLSAVLFLSTVGLMLILLYATYANFERFHDSVQNIRHLNRQKIAMDGMMGSLRDAESGVRGFLITGQESYLEPYRRSLLSYQRFLSDAVREIPPDDRVRPLLDSLSALSGVLHVQLNARVDSVRKHSTSSIPLAAMSSDKSAMDRARIVFDEAVRQVLSTREKALREEAEDGLQAPVMLVIYTAIALAALGILYWRLTLALRRAGEVLDTQRQRNQMLAQAKSRGDRLRAELNAVLDSAPGGIMHLKCVRDEAGRIVDLEWRASNSSANALMGREDLVGRRLLETAGEGALGDLLREHLSIAGKDLSLKREVRSKDQGQDRWLRSHAVPLSDGVLVTFMEITDQKQLELLRLESDKLALTGQITRTVAHEVRNPLTNIHLAIEQLQEDLPADPGTAAYFRIIDRNLERIGALIKGMLGSTQQREIDPEPVELCDVIADVTAHISDRIGLQQMRVEVSVPPDLPRIVVDRDLMVLAITNLAVNAIEAMEHGKGVLRFVAMYKGTGIVLSVEDNGKGMPEEGLAKIFQPFYTGRPGGLGLGLTTTRSILIGHGMRMDAFSTPGQGTRFDLHFPASLILDRAVAHPDR